MLYIALGSNLGACADNIDRALRLIEARVGHVVRHSRYYATKPVGFSSQNMFLNAAAVVETALPAEQILTLTQQIERELGRKAKSVDGHYADRTIDIDLLHLDGVQMHTPALTLPHPRLAERRFVLEPLAEVAPTLFIPSLGRSVASLLHALWRGHIERVSEQSLSASLLQSLNNLLPQLSTSQPCISMEQLRAIAQCPDVSLYVLRDEENEVQATATLTLSRQLTGLKAWVEDVVVNEECRGRGYARQLLKHIEHDAQAMGIKALNLTSRPTRKAANSLYQSEGYLLRHTNVYRKQLQGA